MGYIYTEILSINNFGDAIKDQREAFNKAVIDEHLAYDKKVDELLVSHNQSLQGRNPVSVAELDAATMKRIDEVKEQSKQTLVQIAERFIEAINAL